MRKTGHEVLEKVENLLEVRFVKFEGAIESFPVVFVEVKVESIEVWNAAIHMLNHLVLEFEKSRVIEGDPYMAGESRGRQAWSILKKLSIPKSKYIESKFFF